MDTVWILTILANVVLMAALVCIRAWRRFPIFFGSQLIVVVCEVMLLYAYFSPAVDQLSYHEGWLASDELCILLAIFSAWELWERCHGSLLCIVSILLMIHAALTIWEYRGDVYATFSTFRVDANIFITFALAAVIYLDQKGNKYERN